MTKAGKVRKAKVNELFCARILSVAAGKGATFPAATCKGQNAGFFRKSVRSALFDAGRAQVLWRVGSMKKMVRLICVNVCGGEKPMSLGELARKVDQAAVSPLTCEVIS